VRRIHSPRRIRQGVGIDARRIISVGKGGFVAQRDRIDSSLARGGALMARCARVRSEVGIAFNISLKINRICARRELQLAERSSLC
jgi:hypothetical protein